MSGRKQPPRLMRGGLSGRVYVVTRWRDLGNGGIESLEKWDVTDEYEALTPDPTPSPVGGDVDTAAMRDMTIDWTLPAERVVNDLCEQIDQLCDALDQERAAHTATRESMTAAFDQVLAEAAAAKAELIPLRTARQADTRALEAVREVVRSWDAEKCPHRHDDDPMPRGRCFVCDIGAALALASPVPPADPATEGES